MKQCPQCETRYEDHVDTCIADGTDLDTITDQTLAMATSTAVSGPHRQPPPAVVVRRANPLPWVLVGMLLFALLMFVGVVLLGLTTARVASSAATRLPDTFSIVTEPPGARVLEHGSIVCTTPCALEHPADAPLPREFRVELAGFAPETYTISESTGRHRIRLSAVAPDPPPEPEVIEPPPAPEPLTPAVLTPPKPEPRPVVRPTPIQRPTPRPEPVARPEPVEVPTPEPPRPVKPAEPVKPAPSDLDFGTIDEIKDPF